MAAAPDPRMEFFEPQNGPPSRAATAKVSDGFDAGPSRYHHAHGVIHLSENSELRITTQPAKSPDRPGRIVIRRWYRKPDCSWWPVPSDTGVTVAAPDAQTFGAAVAAAVQALYDDGTIGS
jgi:hypothetical protein